MTLNRVESLLWFIGKRTFDHRCDAWWQAGLVNPQWRNPMLESLKSLSRKSIGKVCQPVVDEHRKVINIRRWPDLSTLKAAHLRRRESR